MNPAAMRTIHRTIRRKRKSIINMENDFTYCRLDMSRYSPEPAIFIVFGASGDLAHRKIFPALWDLFLEGQLPSGLVMIGAARRELSTEEFRESMRASCMVHSRHQKQAERDSTNDSVTSNAANETNEANEARKEAEWKAFSQRIYYLQHDVKNPESYVQIRKLVVERDLSVLDDFGRHGRSLDESVCGADTDELPVNILYYLAVTPEFFPIIAENLGLAGCGSDPSAKGWRRLVVEKPYGKDRNSAARLTRSLQRWFREEDIYRIDHYLGKKQYKICSIFDLPMQFSNRFGTAITSTKSRSQ